MNRRDFIRGGCMFCGALFTTGLRAQHPQPWNAPARFARPDLDSDEGGLWALMDRQERRLRRSPFVIRDHSLNNYVQDIACRLGGKHCPDIRVHLVRTPLFNASMAPNGMMQVWTGLMLRMENEAQLAAVLGHEIAHYLERHTLERLRDIKSASAFATFVGLFGAAGAIGQLATLAATFGFSRDQERAADRIGVLLMRKAGYDPAEAAKVWGNLLAESKARPDGGGASTLPMFATHPGAEERNETLATLAAEQPGGTTNATTWRERVRPFRSDWLREEIKLGQYEESVSLFTRMIESTPRDAELLAARGEVHRRHGGDRQFDLAVADFRAAEQIGHEPPEVHRGLGMIYRRRGASREARASLKHYLELAPQAPDAPMIRSYLEELGQ